MFREWEIVKTIWGERDRELDLWGKRVTVYPIDRWVNLMPGRFESQNLLRLGLGDRLSSGL